VVCYTDGIADSLAEGPSLREDQLEETARMFRHLSAEAILDCLLEKIGSRNGLEDDTTILVLKAS